jgi:hypothetical protein
LYTRLFCFFFITVVKIIISPFSKYINTETHIHPEETKRTGRIAIRPKAEKE